MAYQPKPIDTSNIELPAELDALAERLAKNTHDVWAMQRISDGWEYGPERDDKSLKHPNLVSYVDLSESEKAYDRITAMETLKVVIALGYDIVKSS
jgi:hypothetical protein